MDQGLPAEDEERGYFSIGWGSGVTNEEGRVKSGLELRSNKEANALIEIKKGEIGIWEISSTKDGKDRMNDNVLYGLIS
jgi:hypothetical protein